MLYQPFKEGLFQSLKPGIPFDIEINTRGVLLAHTGQAFFLQKILLGD